MDRGGPKPVSFADKQMGFAERDAVAIELRGARHDK